MDEKRRRTAGARTSPTTRREGAVIGTEDPDTGTFVRSIYLTVADEAEGTRIARALLEERLIACANIFPTGRSLYRWQGEVVDESETVVIAKTVSGRVQAVIERVNELHSYDTPCVVALPVHAGNGRYLDWVAEEASAPPGRDDRRRDPTDG